MLAGTGHRALSRTRPTPGVYRNQGVGEPRKPWAPVSTGAPSNPSSTTRVYSLISIPSRSRAPVVRFARASGRESPTIPCHDINPLRRSSARRACRHPRALGRRPYVKSADHRGPSGRGDQDSTGPLRMLRPYARAGRGCPGRGSTDRTLWRAALRDLVAPAARSRDRRGCECRPASNPVRPRHAPVGQTSAYIYGCCLACPTITRNPHGRAPYRMSRADRADSTPERRFRRYRVGALLGSCDSG